MQRRSASILLDLYSNVSHNQNNEAVNIITILFKEFIFFRTLKIILICCLKSCFLGLLRPRFTGWNHWTETGWYAPDTGIYFKIILGCHDIPHSYFFLWTLRCKSLMYVTSLNYGRRRLYQHNEDDVNKEYLSISRFYLFNSKLYLKKKLIKNKL